jgi:soluble lytic murein transglycosylase-like protein
MKDSLLWHKNCLSISSIPPRATMSIHRIADISFRQLPADARLRDGRPQKADGAEFKEALKSAALNVHQGSHQTTPLTKPELMQMLHIVHAQMNSRLMLALSSDSKQDAGDHAAFLFERLLTAGNAPPARENTLRYGNAYKTDDRYESIIRQSSEAYGVDADLIRSVIAVESNFEPNSTSPKGAMGLMQLMPQTARDLNVQNAYDPVENIRAGTRYLKMLLDRYGGDIDTALAAYNWGMGNVERRSAQLPAETINYVERVTKYYERAKA